MLKCDDILKKKIRVIALVLELRLPNGLRKVLPFATRLLTRTDVAALKPHFVPLRRWCSGVVAQNKHFKEVDPLSTCTKKVTQERWWSVKFKDVEITDQVY